MSTSSGAWKSQKSLAQESQQPKSRSEYIGELKEAVGDLYSYNEQLIDMFFDLFSPQEVRGGLM